MLGRWARVAALLLGLAGCEAPPPPDLAALRAAPAAPPLPLAALGQRLHVTHVAPGHGLVVLYRPTQWDGRLDAYRITVAGQPAVHLRNGERAMLSAPAGAMSLHAYALPNLTNLGVGAALQDMPRLDLAVEPDMVHFVAVTSAANAGPQLRVVSAETALDEAPRLRQIRAP